MHGGTLYIDDGKPLPGAIEETGAQPARDRADGLFQRAQGLRDAAAVSARRSRSCGARFFSRLQCFFYAGAALPPHVLRGLRAAGARDDGPDASRWSPRSARPRRRRRRLSVTDKAREPGVDRHSQRRRRDEARAQRRQARGAAQGAADHAGLLAPAGADQAQRSTRKATTCSATPSVSPTRTTRRRASCSTAASRRTSSCKTGTWVSVGPLRGALHRALRAATSRDVVIAGHDRDEVDGAGHPRRRCLPRRWRRTSTPRRRAADRARPRSRARAVRRRCSPRSTRTPAAARAASRALILMADAALARHRRDDRQGLDQPARRAGQSRRAGRRSLRRHRSPAACDRPPPECNDGGRS